jgi:predicted Mrr-cat superfamily restriction endonuclease
MNAWIVRPYPHLKPRMREFIQKEIIAIGWPNIGDLTSLSPEQIEMRNRTHHPGQTDRRYRLWTSTICRFRDDVKTGDLVIVAPKKSESETVSIGVVSGGYRYDPDTDGEFFGYPHHKSVSWIRHEVRRSSLPTKIEKSLRSQGTLFRTDSMILQEYCRGEGWL